MQTISYWMERGISPEYLLARTREDMVLFAAIAELNREEVEKQLKTKR